MPYLGNTPSTSFATVVKDSFSGDGSETAFTLSKVATTNSVSVFVENVRQEPTTAYAVSGTTLTFTAAPPNASNNIYVLHMNPTTTTTHPAAQNLTAVNGTLTGTLGVTGASTLTGNVALGGTLDMNGAELVLDADADTSITADTDDQIDIRVAGSDQIKISTSEVAFNESSGDIDFRVEGNGDANALFVEGESDNVGIGNNDPLVKLDVTGSNAVPASSGTSQTGALRLGQGAGNGVMDMGFDTTNSQGWIQATNKANLGTNYTLNLNPNGGDVKIGEGDIFFGGSGKGINLGVTSNTDSNTLDDYEEGVFTLSFNGFSNQTVTQGYYVKVGRLCYVTTFLHASGSQNTNSFTCDLPFTAASHSASNNSGYYVGSIGPVMHYRVDTGSAGMVSYVAAGTAQWRLYEVNADGDWVFMQNNAFTSEDQAWISFTYVTAS